jgi:hypothetical protein
MDAITLDRLGVHTVYRMPGIGPVGWVTLQVTGVGGAIERDPEPFVQWVGDFLADPKRSDIPPKFAMVDAVERHVFVPVLIGGAPWELECYLWDIPNRDGFPDPSPARAPTLPEPITQVWVLAEMAARGWRWDGTGWHAFRRRAE